MAIMKKEYEYFLRALYPEYQRGGAVFLPQKYPDFAVTDDYIYRIRREYGE